MTILSESTNLHGILIILTGFAIMGVILALTGAIFDSNFAAVIGCIVFVVFGIWSALYSRDHSQTETEYKALIDDSYTVKELYESYEIVGREGEMYILKAKERDEDEDE